MQERLVRTAMLAGMLMVSVALLFFFPAPVGGFQTSHGPTSTLKEHDRSISLQIASLDLLRIVNFGAPVHAENNLPMQLFQESSGVNLGSSFNLLRC